jgi:hypothetical protein
VDRLEEIGLGRLVPGAEVGEQLCDVGLRGGIHFMPRFEYTKKKGVEPGRM